jgi:hypothetical protein
VTRRPDQEIGGELRRICQRTAARSAHAQRIVVKTGVKIVSSSSTGRIAGRPTDVKLIDVWIMMASQRLPPVLIQNHVKMIANAKTASAKSAIDPPSCAAP